MCTDSTKMILSITTLWLAVRESFFGRGGRGRKESATSQEKRTAGSKTSKEGGREVSRFESHPIIASSFPRPETSLVTLRGQAPPSSFEQGISWACKLAN